MTAVFLAVLKKVGGWLFGQALGALIEWAKTQIEKWKRQKDASNTSDENAKRLEDALEKGNDDEIGDASEDLLNGRRR